MAESEKYPAAELTPDEVKIVERCRATGAVLPIVNGSRAVRDALCPHEEDSENDDNFLAAVNGAREVRDRITGFVDPTIEVKVDGEGKK
ncbi:hypothetical protein HY463_01145 [Candidatus Peregrinibacteria bacterium]|nr:hypothetical protein [Candidatus Peregrinibacteria bacterium]